MLWTEMDQISQDIACWGIPRLWSCLLSPHILDPCINALRILIHSWMYSCNRYKRHKEYLCPNGFTCFFFFLWWFFRCKIKIVTSKNKYSSCHFVFLSSVKTINHLILKAKIWNFEVSDSAMVYGVMTTPLTRPVAKTRDRTQDTCRQKLRNVQGFVLEIYWRAGNEVINQSYS